MGAKLIVLNGKTYRSIEEMPPDIREKYELAMCLVGDVDEDYIPGTIESGNVLTDALENIPTGNVIVNSTKIDIDGKEFDSPDSLPPEARARYEEAVGKLDVNRNGIPDFVEGMISTNQAASISTSLGTTTSPRSTRTSQDKPLPGDSVITPDTSEGWSLAFAALFLLILCAVGVGGVWYFFFR